MLYEVITLEVRGLDNIKEATYKVAGIDVNVAVVHGGKAIGDFLEMMKTSGKQYHFVEFMGCTGGCINGGGRITSYNVCYTKLLREMVLFSRCFHHFKEITNSFSTMNNSDIYIDSCNGVSCFFNVVKTTNI